MLRLWLDKLRNGLGINPRNYEIAFLGHVHGFDLTPVSKKI
jgi:hypothetical protein